MEIFWLINFHYYGSPIVVESPYFIWIICKPHSAFVPHQSTTVWSVVTPASRLMTVCGISKHQKYVIISNCFRDRWLPSKKLTFSQRSSYFTRYTIQLFPSLQRTFCIQPTWLPTTYTRKAVTQQGTFSHLNPIHRASHFFVTFFIIHPITHHLLMWRQASYEAAGVGTLGAVAATPHTGGQGNWIVLHWHEAEVESGSHLDDWAALFRNALLTSMSQDTGVLTKAGLPNVFTLLMHSKLR